MKKYLFLAMAAMMAAACSNKTADKTAKVAESSRLTECNVSLNGLHFTKSLNGAENQVSDSAGIVTFRAKPQADFFCDPNGKISQDDAAILFMEIDNKKPFTYSAKVRTGFTPEGTYNAAVLFVYANDTLWQKLCFEQDERGTHRVVSVRTIGTSDDNNHEVVNDDTECIYFKISSDTQTIANYYSLDGKTWQMVRLYKNEYGDKIYLGICSQAPQSDECISTFENLQLTTDHVKDFRLGE